MVRCSRVRAFVRSCVTLAPFRSLWPAFTLTVHINAIMKVYIDRKSIHVEFIRFLTK